MLSHLSSHAGELKSQGAIEAARDPNSNVSRDDAQSLMVDESKKAGSVAFRFNPDASPEEKAALASASVPPGFHHQHKPKAIGIVTDLDDGSPEQNDLPRPNKEDVISSPSSLTAEGSITKANGHMRQGENEIWEKERWEKEVGWAPRFGEGSITEAEANESLLDHTTFLETKLDDKFLGDWYHNTAIIVFACISSWVVALLGGGLGWLFLVMACCGTYYRTSIRRVRRNFRDDILREQAKARLETDTESLEWINSFLVKFWPIYAPNLCKAIILSVDQVLSTSTPAFLDSLRLSTFQLGTKPPRLDHVKTYPRIEDEIVLMDWKFSFTPNDTMDLTARQLKNKINPKVVLEIRIGKGVISKSLPVIVEDFAFSGLMRVKVKLQLPFPHVEKIEICFLGKPEIDYVCKPIGGDTLGFDINFIPGLESFIKDQIHGNLAPIMYEPNVFPIEIAKMLAGNPIDQAIGVIAVTIHGAQGLKNPDKLAGSPDPYAIVSLNGGEALGKTKMLKQNVNPRWNETVYVIITSLTDTLTVKVFDYNEYRKDKELGTASFALDRLEDIREHENLQLELVANGKPRGIVQADVRYFPVLHGMKLEDGTEEPPPESNTGIARFTVEQAKDLDGSKSLIGQLNPYAVLLLNGREIHITEKLKRTNQPVWERGSKEFLITDRKAARLGLKIKDDRDIAADPTLGTLENIKLDDLMQQMEKGKEWYNLSGAKTGRVKLMLQWKPVGLKGIMGGSGGYITPIGVMRLHLQNARDLRNVETMGKSDPYLRVLLSGIEKGKTVTFQNNLNPDWDEVIYVPMHSPREHLILEVMDYQSIGKDRSLGLVGISAADYIHEATNGEYAVHDPKRPLSEPLRMNGKGNPKGILNFTVSFYPTLNLADPEDDEEDKDAVPTMNGTHSQTGSKNSLGEGLRMSMEKDAVEPANQRMNNAGKIDTNLARQPSMDEQDQEDGLAEVKVVQKLRLTPEELFKHESGLLIFKLISGDLAHTNVHLEVLMDDMAFPSYVSSRARSKHTEFGETGDAFVRELDVSRITLRLMEKQDKKGGDDAEEHTIAKLEGDTLSTLQGCLNQPTELVLKGPDNAVSKIRASLKYIPVKMQLDPSESINNQGTLRVDILDATELPAADRNGFSDPFCKFELNGKTVYKTKVQKKTLHPAWNEYFECPIQSRTAANFKVKVMDWDFGDKADFLGGADINLELLEPIQSQEVTLALDGKSGALRLRLLFKPSYVTRSRQGSSTFSGTFATPGKVIGAPVKGVGKVGGAVGGGVMKGASFLRHGFKGKNDSRDISNGSVEPFDNDEFTNGSPIPIPKDGVTIGGASPPPFVPTPYNRSASFGNKSINTDAGAPGKPEAGTAMFSILSASGYPPHAKVQIHVKQVTSRGAKEVHKTKGIKAASGQVYWEHETFKLTCAPDTQFLIQVKDDKVFGSDELGEAPFFIDDSATGSEKTVQAGSGTVTLKSSFIQADAGSVMGSPKHGNRRSLLSKRDGSRNVTPS